MAADGETADGRRGRGIPWRIIGWGGVALLLMLPLVTRAPWTLSDYIIAGIFLGGAGLALEILARVSGSFFYRLGALLAVAAAILLVWVNGAVGFLADEDNPANLLFMGVIAIAVVGAIVARFSAAGMARAMFATAGAQILVGLAALVWGLGSAGTAGLYEAVMGTTVFSAMWLLSGGLFSKAAREQASAELG